MAQAPKKGEDKYAKYTSAEQNTRSENAARVGNKTEHEDTVRVEDTFDVTQQRDQRTFGNALYLLVYGCKFHHSLRCF